MAEPRTAPKRVPRKPKEEPAADRSGSAAPAEPETGSAKGHVCPVAFCPIGMALSSVQQAGPEVLDHLLAAAREFLLAARAVVDARASDMAPNERGGRLERIEIG